MMEREILCLFYGSFINPNVMLKAGHTIEKWEVAMVPGFEIRISPHANLVRMPDRSAFGLLTPMSHSKLATLYRGQSRGQEYLPEGVTAHCRDGSYRAAISYLVTNMTPGQAEAEYVEMIALPAEQYGFPAWYVDQIRSFAPTVR